jgi:hypothetical protein
MSFELSDNLTSMNDSELEFGALNLFISDNIQYFNYTLFTIYFSIFLLGIIGNSIVIYVLVSSICVDRSYYSRKNQQHTQISQNGISRVNSFRGPTHNNISKKNSLNNNGLSFPGQSSSFFRRVLKEKLSVTNLYLLNLALGDFMYIVFIPVLVCTIFYERWIFGSAFCKIYFSLAYLCQSSNVFILVVLSVDRFISVKYPHKVSKFRSDRLARIIISISWMLSFLVILPVIIYADSHSMPDSNNGLSNISSCTLQWPENWNFSSNNTINDFINGYFAPLHAFNAYTLIFNFLIPVIIICILYIKILGKLHANNSNTTIKKSKQKKKSHKKITKMVLAIIICYIVFWTPYWLAQVYYYVHSQILKLEYSPLLSILSNFAQVLCYMSSMLNPFIYSYMSEAFKNDLRLACSNCYCCVKFFSNSKRTNKVPENEILNIAGSGKQKNTKKMELVEQNSNNSQTNLTNKKFSKKSNKTIVFDEELDHLNQQEIQEENQQGINSNGNNVIHPVQNEKRSNSMRKLVLKSSKNFEFEIKFHSLSGGSGQRSKFLNKLFNRKKRDLHII